MCHHESGTRVLRQPSRKYDPLVIDVARSEDRIIARHQLTDLLECRSITLFVETDSSHMVGHDRRRSSEIRPTTIRPPEGCQV